MTTYGFDHGWQGERDRMALAEFFLDPVTVRHLESIGVSEGWRCLEVGAGAGSVARWLTRRVGRFGRVLATDIDTRFVEALAAEDLSRHGSLEVRRHDIVADEPLPAVFHLAHVRLVLQHLPGREEAVKRMAAAVEPGGWVLAEELDFASSTPALPHQGEAFRRVETAIHQLLSATGFEPACGRRLPGLLQDAGLIDVECTGALSVVSGGSPIARWQGQTFEALRPRLVASGLASNADVDQAIGELADPGFSLMTPVLISARGRRARSRS